jgi:hypothetical protein
VGGDVGDMDPHARPVALPAGGDGVVEVVRRRGVDREGRLGSEVAARAGVRRESGDRLLRLGLEPVGEGRPEPSLGEQRGDDVPRAVRPPEVDERLGAASIDPAERDPSFPQSNLAPREGHLSAALEERLADQIATAA